MSTIQTLNNGETGLVIRGKINDNFNALNTDKAETSALTAGLATKQDTLVSGTNIKTINGNSLLGSGDISISGGGSTTLDGLTDVTISSATNGQALIYESASSQWKNQSLPGGGDMLKSTYDTDNDGVVDYASGTTSTVRNQTGATLTKGTIIYINGGTGGLPTVAKGQANAESTSAGTFGAIFADLANNSNGTVVKSGRLANVDTRTVATNPITSVTLADGDTLYLDPTTAGYVTNVKPVAPNHMVYIGKVITAGNNGIIDLNIRNGYELDEIHDVLITSKTDNDGLFYETSSGLWKNKNGGVVINALTAKTTPVDADMFGLMDSASSNVLKKLSWANIKATLKTYFDSVTTTLTNKTLTSPVINTPTGIVKGDVGLGNVDNTSDATKNSATATLTNKTITKPTIQASVQNIVTIAATVGGTTTLDLSTSNCFIVTLGGNTTMAISNATVGQHFWIQYVQDATGSRTVTQFSTIKWAGGTAPTLTTTATKKDWVGHLCTSAGNYDGVLIDQNI